MNDGSRRAGGGFPLVALLFCVSGVSALVYQVAWQRILALHSGVGIYSVSMIVAAFLAGLGIGSYFGARLCRRMEARRALYSFAWIELAVGFLALGSCFLYYDLLYGRMTTLYASPLVAGVLHFVALLLPTALMGMSLPFLVQATVEDATRASRTISLLYGLNVIGACLGALAAPWILIRLLGIRGAVQVGAAGNLLVGVCAMILAFRAVRIVLVDRDEEPVPVVGEQARRPFALWVALYTLSGFVALSLEILWFRVVDVAVKSTAFTFGTVLAIFLGGLAVGSLLGGRFSLRVRRPLYIFLVLQIIVVGYSAAALWFLARAPVGFPLYSALVEYWAGYEEFKLGLDWRWSGLASLYLLLPAALYGPPTICMGLSFGVLQRAVHDDRATSGFKVGVLQAANIAGNVAGSLLCGLVLLHWLGTPGTMRVLLVIGLGFVAIAYASIGPRLAFHVGAAVLLVLLVMLPGRDAFWGRLHGFAEPQGWYDEDATALASITPDENGTWRVSVNGKGHSWLPFGGIHSQLGALPALVHPEPRDVAIIGLGSGDTAWAAGARSVTRELVVWELGAPEMRLLNLLNAAEPLPRLDRFLADPRYEVIVGDGRNALVRDGRKYDLIEADALRPHSAYAGNIYSEEFFELCASRLKPGGLMCSWAPTPRTYRTFCKVFPYVVDFGGQVLVGSRQPIAIEPAVWRARLGQPDVRAYLGDVVASDIARSLATARPATPEFVLRYEPNRDLFPRDELRSPGPR